MATDRPTGAKPGPKPTLTRSAVIEAALDLIDRDGLAALNLRKLAASLNVSAMTPYGYFADKSELLNAMVDRALGALTVDPGSTAPWHEQLAAAMRGMHESLERHPGVIELILAEAETAALDKFRRAQITMLVGAGLTPVQSADALRTLSSYILGYTMLTRLRGRPKRSLREPGSFDHGLSMLIEAIRTEAGSASRRLSDDV